MSMMTRILVLALLVPLTVQADPGRVPRWLMNEPMSQFDWGMQQMEEKLEQLKFAEKVFTAKYFFSDASYDWDADRIRLQVNFHGKGNEAECIYNIKRAKGAILNFTWDEAEQTKIARDVLTNFFSHRGGYDNKNKPADIGEQLANITILETTIFVQGDNGTYLPKAKCTTDFKTNAVSVTHK